MHTFSQDNQHPNYFYENNDQSRAPLVLPVISNDVCSAARQLLARYRTGYGTWFGWRRPASCASVYCSIRTAARRLVCQRSTSGTYQKPSRRTRRLGQRGKTARCMMGELKPLSKETLDGLAGMLGFSPTNLLLGVFRCLHAKSGARQPAFDRISACHDPQQAENYRSDAYGMRNWNGNGVVISLMLEKQ